MTADSQLPYDLFREIVREGHLVLAPASLNDALGVFYYGSDGETELQFKQLIFADQPRESVALSARKTQLVLDGYLSEGLLFVGGDCEVLPAFSDALTLDWQTTLHRLPGALSSEESRGQMTDMTGAFVSETDLPMVDMIDPGARAVLFGVWKSEFQRPWARSCFWPHRTKSADFYTAPQTSFEVAMMAGSGSYRYGEDEVFQCLVLEYSESAVELVLLLPKDAARAGQAFGKLEANYIVGLLSSVTTREVNVWLPRVDASAAIDWKQPLMHLGLDIPFTAGIADFSRINGDRPAPLFVSGIRQLVNVRWNEEGTRAVAVSVASADPFGPPVTELYKPELPVRFRANHPFAFIIRSIQRADILFMGIISQPDQMPRGD